MSKLANQLVREEREDVARCVRALLADPMLTIRNHPDAFELVRRRRQPVTQWFEYYCGWRLVVEPRAGYARLVKVRADPDPHRPARRARSTRAPFDRRRYVLLCVVAAELMAGPVTTIGLLADRVVRATAADPELASLDTSNHGERKAYVDVLKLLEQLGVLDVVDGTTENYLSSEDAKVLYRVDTTRLVRLIATPNAPSRILAAPAGEPSSDGGAAVAGPATTDVDTATGTATGTGTATATATATATGTLIARMTAEPRYGDGADPDATVSDVQRNLWLRHSVMRRLVDDPVVYRDELTAAQLGYLASPTGRQIMRQAAERAGFELEERAEGYLLVDPEAIATDTKFPDDSSNAKVAALTLLDELRAAPAGLTVEQLAVEAQRLLARRPTWAKTYRSDDGARRLADDAVDVLCAFGLVRRGGPDGAGTGTGTGTGTVLARPAAARYRDHSEDLSRLAEPPTEARP